MFASKIQNRTSVKYILNVNNTKVSMQFIHFFNGKTKSIDHIDLPWGENLTTLTAFV